MKTPISKIHGAAHKFTIIREIIGEEEEKTSQSLCIYNGIHSHTYPNDNTSPFIEKTRVTSCEITKLLLARVLEFYELRSFQARPLHHCTSPSCQSALSLRVLLRLDASECSSGVIPSCYSGATMTPPHNLKH